MMIEQRWRNSIAEGKTILKGKLSPEKREQIERSVASTEWKLDQLRKGQRCINCGHYECSHTPRFLSVRLKCGTCGCADLKTK